MRHDERFWLMTPNQFALAISRSMQSLQVKPLSPWKLMLRDGLNLYAVSAKSLWKVRDPDSIDLGNLDCEHGQHAFLVHHHSHWY